MAHQPLEAHTWRAWATSRTVPVSTVIMAWVVVVLLAISVIIALKRINSLSVTVHPRDQSAVAGTVSPLPEATNLEREVAKWVEWTESWTDATLESLQTQMLATLHPLIRLDAKAEFKDQIRDAKRLHRAQSAVVIGMTPDAIAQDGSTFHVAIWRFRYTNDDVQSDKQALTYNRQDLVVLTIRVSPDVITEENRLGIVVRSRSEMDADEWISKGKPAFWKPSKAKSKP